MEFVRQVFMLSRLSLLLCRSPRNRLALSLTERKVQSVGGRSGGAGGEE